MRGKIEPLLCELHAHTTWSDGELSLPQLVDLYGRSGFDVLGITDHCIRTDDPWRDTDAAPAHVHAGNLAPSRRSRGGGGTTRRLRPAVVPGLELTYNDLDPYPPRTVALGCRAFVTVDRESTLRWRARARAALIAAHPFRTKRSTSPDGQRCASPGLARPAPLADRREHCRYDLFGW
jgi:hypothetical protein